MIGKLKGTLVEREAATGLIETQSGVFYQVYLTPQYLSALLPLDVEIYTYLQVREDALILFGFETKSQKDLFTLLLTVPGVGPKTAFSVISLSPPDELFTAVRENRPEYFKKIPGLGQKTALKIILELSGKLDTELQKQTLPLSSDDTTVLDALTSLGFKTSEARPVVNDLDHSLSLEEKITTAIKLLTVKK